jgi:hypothetical protein
MGYNEIADMRDSSTLRRRLVASAAQEHKPTPESWIETRIWQIVSSPGWDAAWASALASGNKDPGSSEAVITDGMILGAVQPLG